ncbi:MAG TPA: type III-B CRISPR module-associated protein Cmr5 [Blastocatellia bacterium]|nr:type III-B CRISPR module-associated protein Cmr5 [Blastocatellia bacterium]
MPSLQQTKDQERAAQAWRCVEEVKKKGKEFGSKYKSLVQKMPSYILTNGLGQSLAFLNAKTKGNPLDEHALLYEHLSNWVRPQVDPTSSQPLLQWVMNNDSNAYRRATAEALAFINWLKRFAEAELGE